MHPLKNDAARVRLGAQLSAARLGKSWTLEQVAHRTGLAGPRLSEMETGKANSTIDTHEVVGRVLNLHLLFIPDNRLREVLDLLNISGPSPASKTHTVPSIFDEVFIDEGEDEDASDVAL